MKWCKIVKFIILALLVCSVALFSGCSKEIKYSPNPHLNVIVDSENDENDELLFELKEPFDMSYVEEAKRSFLDFCDEREKKELQGKTVTIREPYNIYNTQSDNPGFHFVVFADQEPYAYIGVSKNPDGKFYGSYAKVADFPKWLTMKKGCYRYTLIKNGTRIESVKYDSSKNYGNINSILYTFTQKELE